MAIDFPEEARAALEREYQRGRLTLYLGAGVSAPSGLPTWQRLVLAMYFDMLRQSNRRAYSNYLHAVAEWMLAKSPDPLEITAQKIRKYFGSKEDAFLASLKKQLYAGFARGSGFRVPPRRKLRRGNPTLRAVARLCEGSSRRKGRGVEGVITYNYDNLLEIALLKGTRFQVVDGPEVKPDRWSLPIYHVHGYVPIKRYPPTRRARILFTEQQYHDATNDAYSWSNLVQLRGMSSSTGLMVGLSLSDRNVRRLLHALSRSSVPARCYAVLQRPSWKQPHDHELLEIDDLARDLYDRAEASGAEQVLDGYGLKGEEWQEEIRLILDRAQAKSTLQHSRVLRDLGVIPIWYGKDEDPHDHSEVAEIVQSILPE